MTTALTNFSYRLYESALHIDYLRLRCGKEEDVSNHFKRSSTIRAHIAFSEWDVVLFIPSIELYPPNLVKIYSNKKLAAAIAGSAGFFNYLWTHPINKGWKRRILRRNKTISMLVSLRFTDTFRRTLGLGAELLFCSFLHEILKSDPQKRVSAVVAHSMGWNDATILLDATVGNEDIMLEMLTRIRYCREGDLIKGSTSNARAVAATYSHLLGNLETYTDKRLRFNSFNQRVKAARILVRVNPDVERDLRKQLRSFIEEKMPDPNGADCIGSDNHRNHVR